MATLKSPKKAPQTGGAFLDVPGIYHMNIVHVDEQPTSAGGKLLDGIKVQFAVLEGPENGKSFEFLFFSPNETDNDGGEDAAAALNALCIAAGLLTEADLKNEENDITWANLKDRQVIVDVRRKQEKTAEGKWVDTKFLKVNKAGVYHIDDPRAANIPKNAAATKLLPKEQRRNSASFDMVALTGKQDIKLLGESKGGDSKSKADSKPGTNGNGSSNGNGNGSHGGSKPAVDALDDLLS